MAGAYTAKPDAVVSLDLPPGWNEIWPFPGAFPPGYTPDYTIAINAPASVAAGETAQATVMVFDHVEYKTNAPSNGVNFVGSLEFHDDVGGDLDYSINDQGFYFATISVDTSSLDVGKSISWTATSDPFGVGELSGASSTVVIAATSATVRIEITYTAAAVGSANASQAEATIYRNGFSSSATISNTDPPDYNAVGQGWSATDSLLQAEEEIAEDTVYGFNISASVSAGDGQYGDAEIDYDLSVYVNDVLKYHEADVLFASVGNGGFDAMDRIFEVTIHLDGTVDV